jgi:hypothetical protein
MPSPFPGMDPWLEAADIWPCFHDSFAAEIMGVLNQALPPPYYARLETRPEIGVVDNNTGDGYARRVVPDVAVVNSARASHASGASIAVAAPRTEISQSVEIVGRDEEGRHLSVEIRDPRRNHRLVSFIEIVSPANKTSGVDRQSYLDKQQEIYGSEASLIEIDLLRGGRRLLPNLFVEQYVAELKPPPNYLVLVNRSWMRAGASRWQVFPIVLRESLPVIPVPLREGEPELPLDLQFVFNRAYDNGPYRRGAVDYSTPPHPRLSKDDSGWANELLVADANRG